MRKIKLFNTRAICLLLLFCFHQSLFAQAVKESPTNRWTTQLENGRKQRTTGIVNLGIGATLITVCALLPSPERRLFSPGISAGQLITGLGGFVFTTAGLINFLSGISKVHKAKVRLGETSYYIHPKQTIQGPSIAFLWQLGK
jgi:hypothetical protein